MNVYGVAATVTGLSAADVKFGHVAAWVGVGGTHAGPHGEDEWIQVGYSAFPGSDFSIYYEVAKPGSAARYTEVASGIGPKEKHRLAVLELDSKPGWWQVWVDGKPASDAVYLPSSHGRWRAVATAESWNGGRSVCNGYSYRFEQLALKSRYGAAWRTFVPAWILQDQNYRVLQRTSSSFVASLSA